MTGGDRLLVAFSGGPDSTALAWLLARLAPEQVHLAHLDHALDPDSGRRAERAERSAHRHSLPLHRERIEVAHRRRRGESPEAAARRIRYDWLESTADRLGARWIATGHQREDQAETVLLRILHGSGLRGLSAIQPRHGRRIRPLLQTPRAEIEALLRAERLPFVSDPTNRDPGIPRNRVRHALLPRLGRDAPKRLAALAEAARSLRETLDPTLLAYLETREDDGWVSVDRGRLHRLDPSLLEHALAAMHRRAGLALPPSRSSRRELKRQLASEHRVGCDAGQSWRWQSRGGSRLLLRSTPQPTPRFSYTLGVPGEIDIPELSLTVRVYRGDGSSRREIEGERRVALRLPVGPGDSVTVRNRRPGDRIRPLGHRTERRLKEILIDRKVPREMRDRIPLLCVGERIAWVPGVTSDERMKPEPEQGFWIAEVTRA